MFDHIHIHSHHIIDHTQFCWKYWNIGLAMAYLSLRGLLWPCYVGVVYDQIFSGLFLQITVVCSYQLKT